MKIRTTIGFLLPAFLFIFLSGCQEDTRNEVFEVVGVMDFTIEAGLSTFDTHFYTISPVVSNFPAQLEALNLQPEDILSVEPKSAELSSVFRDENLEFIERISLRIFKVDDPQFNREIFYFDPVPFQNKTVLRPFPGLSNVKEIVENQFYGIELRLDFRIVPPRTIDMRFEYLLSARR